VLGSSAIQTRKIGGGGVLAKGGTTRRLDEEIIKSVGGPSPPMRKRNFLRCPYDTTVIRTTRKGNEDRSKTLKNGENRTFLLSERKSEGVGRITVPSSWGSC